MTEDLGWTILLEGAYLLQEFRTAAPLVHLEHHRASLTTDDHDDVAAYLAATDTLRTVALDADTTATLLKEHLTRMEQQ